MEKNCFIPKRKSLSFAMRSCMVDQGEPSGDGLMEQAPNRSKLDMQRIICEGLREKLRKIGTKGVNRSELLEEVSKISDFLAGIWEE